MNNKIKQFIAFGVCSVVALVLCMTVLVVTVNNLSGDTDATENNTIINKTELDSFNETLIKYINKLISETEGRFVKTKTYTDVSVNNIEVLNSAENKEKDAALLNFAKDRILPVIDSYYADDFAGSFEKDDSKKLSIVLNKNALKNASFSVGQADENGESVLDDAGNVIDNDFYFLTYNIDIKNKSFDKKFAEMLSVKDDISAKEKFVDAVNGDISISDFQAEPDSFIIKAKINRTNDEIQYINVIRSYEVKLDAAFINDAELFGEKELYFVYTVTDTYEYSYAGISFIEDAITLEHDEEYMLNVNAVIDDDSEYNVKFSSSDENIAIVDEMGYVKALKNSDNPVTITVELKYLGETFTDTCLVNVSDE